VFQNPFSTRRISDVTVTHLQSCKSEKALVEGSTRLPAFVPREIPQSFVKITSSSSLIGDTQATLTIEVTLEADLKRVGGVKVKSPPWYLKEQTGQQGVNQDYYAESMINFDSEVTLSTTQSGAQIEAVSVFFDQSVLNLMIDYESNIDILKGEKLILTVVGFQNPVDPSPVSGF
jgi:hypothetical protein